ncbi:MAG: hypothetical protein ACI4TS_01010 [Bacteroidaceae bacterium]
MPVDTTHYSLLIANYLNPTRCFDPRRPYRQAGRVWETAEQGTNSSLRIPNSSPPFRGLGGLRATSLLYVLGSKIYIPDARSASLLPLEVHPKS